MALSLKFKIFFLSFIVILSFAAAAPVVLVAAEPGVNKARAGLESTAREGGLAKAGEAADLPVVIGKIVGAVLAFVGVIFFCLIVWSGFSWMLAKGNEEEIKKAKETIFGAVLGLMVILGAYAITRLIAWVFSQAPGG